MLHRNVVDHNENVLSGCYCDVAITHLLLLVLATHVHLGEELQSY